MHTDRAMIIWPSGDTTASVASSPDSPSGYIVQVTTFESLCAIIACAEAIIILLHQCLHLYTLINCVLGYAFSNFFLLHFHYFKQLK